MLKIVYTLS